MLRGSLLYGAPVSGSCTKNVMFRVLCVRNGSSRAVLGSGSSCMSDSWMAWNPRIDFEVSIAHQRRAAMTGTGDVEHIQVKLLDHPVQMHIDEVLARRRAPMS